MNSKLRMIVVIVGLVLSIVGIILIYQKFQEGHVDYIPFIIFLAGVVLSFKMLIKTKHKSTKFRLMKNFEAEEE